jgi:hypothetical protein
MNKKTLVIVLLIILWTPFFAQEKNISGTVKCDTTFLQVINVLNLSNMTGTATDKNGKFNIQAKVGDSILFSSLVYVNRFIKIAPEHFNTGELQVYLEPDYEQLETVTIDPRLKINYGNPYVPEGTVFDEDKISKKLGPDSRKLTDPTDRFSGVNFIGLLRNLTRKSRLNKKREEQEILRKRLEIQRLPQKLVNTYGQSFFTEWLRIPQDEIFTFLEFCLNNGLSNELETSEIRLVDFLLKNSKSYLELKKEE